MLKAAWPVNDNRLAGKVLPAVRAATVMHAGPYDGPGSAYEALFARVNRNGYQVVLPMREVSHNDPQTTPPEQLVTGIILPVVNA